MIDNIMYANGVLCQLLTLYSLISLQNCQYSTLPALCLQWFLEFVRVLKQPSVGAGGPPLIYTYERRRWKMEATENEE